MAKKKQAFRDNETKVRPEVVRELTRKQKKKLLCIILRSETAYLSVRQTFGSREIREYFPESVRIPYAQVFLIANSHFNRKNKLPGKAQLLSRLEDEIASNEYALNELEQARARNLIEEAFSGEYDTEDHVELAIQYARRFGHEATTKRMRRQLKEDADDIGVAPILSEAMEALQKVDAVGSADTTGRLFGKNWDLQAPIPLRPTGCSAFDEFLSGGDKEGEVNLFMGPYASCKTLVCVQCTCAGVDGAIAAMARGELEDKHPICVMVSYESNKEEFEMRCICYMAKVPFDRINSVKSIHELAGPGDPPPKYERKLFREQIAAGHPPLSEKERMQIAMRKAERHIRFIDFSGGEGVGSGGVSEIVGRIELLKRHDKNPYIWAVFIDHLDAMVDKMMNENNIKIENKRHILKATPLDLRHKIAERYKTRIWLMHQLSAETNSRNPTARIHHTDGAECKAVAQYCAHAIVTGNKDENNRCVWRVTKKRRVNPKRSELVMQIDGAFSRVINLGDKYTVDYDARALIPRPKKPKDKTTEEDGRRRRQTVVVRDSPGVVSHIPAGADG